MANIAMRRSAEPSAPTVPAAPVATSPSFLGRWDPMRWMDNLLRWEPFLEMLPTQALSRQFSPDFDVVETNDSYIFKADLPGVKESDIQITVSGNQLTVSGKRELDLPPQDVQNCYVGERFYGEFSRTFTLPQGADLEHVRAEMKDGVLTVVVPKRPEVQPRRIELGTGGATGGGTGGTTATA